MWSCEAERLDQEKLGDKTQNPTHLMHEANCEMQCYETIIMGL